MSEIEKGDIVEILSADFHMESLGIKVGSRFPVVEVWSNSIEINCSHHHYPIQSVLKTRCIIYKKHKDLL